MEEQNDKSKTVEFKPIKDDKPYKKEAVERSRDDVYSEARREAYSPYEDEDEEDEEYSSEKGSEKKLVYFAIGLAVFLVAIIIVGVFIINNGGMGGKSKNENIDGIVTDSENPQEKEEEKKEEENQEAIPEKPEKKDENKTVNHSVVFYGDSVENKGTYYLINADLYDRSFKRTDSQKILINSSTVIKENGKRITPDALVYIVENLAGEMIIFDGEIRESDNFAVSLSFSGSFKEHLDEETEKTPDSDTEKPAEENPPVIEDNNESQKPDLNGEPENQEAEKEQKDTILTN